MVTKVNISSIFASAKKGLVFVQRHRSVPSPQVALSKIRCSFSSGEFIGKTTTSGYNNCNIYAYSYNYNCNYNYNRNYYCSKTSTMTRLPSMIVFDLDDCLWTPEMHELPGCPEIPVHGILNPHGSNGGTPLKGVVGLQVPRYRDTVTLYDGARRVLYELAVNPVYKGVLLATASSSLEPSYSYACLAGIEILPGRTLGDMMSYHQIGRTGRLSPDKTTHFQELHEESGVPFHEMLFFDDWCVALPVQQSRCDAMPRFFFFTGRENPPCHFQRSRSHGNAVVVSLFLLYFFD